MNLFQQAIYRGRPQPQQNTAMTGDDIRNTMCERGLTGVKATALVHSGKWKNHKYLYIDSNGKYVYPEDVTNKAKSGINSAKEGLAKAVANQKQKLKDKKYLYDEKHRKYKSLEDLNATHPNGKRVNQITSSHQEGTKKVNSLTYESTHESGNDTYTKVKRHEDGSVSFRGFKSSANPELNKQKKNTAARKQQKSAHAGYERDKRIFPDGGSTEELENQKQKTKDRKFNGKTTRKSINQQLNNAHSVGRSEKWLTEGKNMSTEELERQKERIKERTKARTQQKSAHAGYEADKKKFPDGGSTEELEKQKEKTKARKNKKRLAEAQQKSAHSQANKRLEGYKRYAETYNKEHGTNYNPEDFYTPYTGLENQLKKKRSAKRRRELTGQR